MVGTFCHDNDQIITCSTGLKNVNMRKEYLSSPPRPYYSLWTEKKHQGWVKLFGEIFHQVAYHQCNKNDKIFYDFMLRNANDRLQQKEIKSLSEREDI